MNRQLFISCLICLAFYSCRVKPEAELRFMFIGDIHYQAPDYRTAHYLVSSIKKEVDTLKYKPEFIIQTGDFFHGGRNADSNAESDYAFSNFSENFRIPFHIAKGNHDARDPFEKNSLPLISAELGREVRSSYYSFDKAGCHFIIIDCTDEDISDQISWLEKDLEAARKSSATGHIFVAGHYPLWIVARAGFSNKEFSTRVAELLAKYKVDAYLCGHTHNKTLTVRMINGQPLTQIMDAGVVEENRLSGLAPFTLRIKPAPSDTDRPGILPLEEGHQIFIPEKELKYYYGYQEGSTTSYYIITVKGNKVQADWHVLGEGVIRSVEWNEPGLLKDIRVPVKKEGKPLDPGKFDQIAEAWLYAAPWTDEENIAATFRINNIPAGKLEMNKARMAGSPFWNKIEIPLDPSVVKLKMENEVAIDNPAKGRFGLAHVFILVKFTDGSFARSSISKKVVTSFVAQEKSYPNFPEAALIESVNQGEPLSKIDLNFDRYIAF